MCMCKTIKNANKISEQDIGSSKKKNYVIKGALQCYKDQKLVATGSIHIEMNNVPSLAFAQLSK